MSFPRIEWGKYDVVHCNSHPPTHPPPPHPHPRERVWVLFCKHIHVPAIALTVHFVEPSTYYLENLEIKKNQREQYTRKSLPVNVSSQTGVNRYETRENDDQTVQCQIKDRCRNQMFGYKEKTLGVFIMRIY